MRVYGVSKLAAEKYCSIYNDLFGLPVFSFRYAIVYGPDEWYGGVMTIFIKRALEGKPLIVFGNGRQTRDFTYISDTVSGIIKAANDNRLLGNVINIARGQKVSVLDIARIICKQTGLPFSPMMKSSRPNDVLRHFANITKAKKILAFIPKITIQNGLTSYISWIKNTYPDLKKLLKLIPLTNW